MVRRRKARPGNPLLAVAYLRVSTEDQALGPKAQARAIEAWAAREGVQLVAYCIDQGVSGGTALDQRPGLVEALALVQGEAAGVLVAAKRDRLARDPGVMGTIETTTANLGAIVRTADGASDTQGAAGVIDRGVRDVFAAYERVMIAERTKAALAVKRARGERLGGRHLPYGQRLAADGIHLEPHPEEQAVIARARTLRSEGRSIRDISEELEAEGMLNRAGKAFGTAALHAMLAGPA
jgi:DNA invertase Pin-like site-specific DNA recombinase